MRLKTLLLILFFPVLIFIYSCGATSTVRYDRNKENEKKEVKGNNYKETFDIAPYRTKIEIKKKPVPEESAGDIDI